MTKIVTKRCILIGSFRKDFEIIKIVATLFTNNGIDVLSPRMGDIINMSAEFVTLSTDRFGDAKSIQNEVFEKMKRSDFVYVVNPSGRVGLSTAFEMGFVHSIQKPIYAMAKPEDATLQHYVDSIVQPEELVAELTAVTPSHHLFCDADDTLWDDQGKLQRLEKEIEAMIDKFLGVPSFFQQKFIETEHKNIPVIGFGFPSYAFSLAETFAEYRLPELKKAFLEIFATFKHSYLHESPELFPHVPETLQTLRTRGYRLHLVSRGIRNEQLDKLNRTGLTDLFDTIHIVPKKDVCLYQQLMLELKTLPETSYMIGNSLKSDVNPALAAGMGGVWIPAANPWNFDEEQQAPIHTRYKVIQQFAELLNFFS